MKTTFNPSLWTGMFMACLAACTMILSGCDPSDDGCKNCSADYREEKRVRMITHYNASNALTEKYRFFYEDLLLDSLVKVMYSDNSEARKAADDSTMSVLKVYYPAGRCMPSYYEAKTYIPAEPVSVEKGIMSVSGARITNRHLAFYPDEAFLVPDETAEIDYLYNGSDQVTGRSGTDYGILAYPHPYGNENFYTYAASNIATVGAWKEQAGYNLNKTFDANHNPFNIQSGVMYYLTLIAYTDQEYFETICQDKNNVTQIVYTGTDTSNSHVTITFTFTYSYDIDNYPAKVAIYEEKDDDIYGDSETDHGTYLFQYY